MLAEPMKACLLFNVEPGQDSLSGSQALDTLRDTGMVIHFGHFRSAEIEEVAHVMLPIASLHETDGSHVNCEGEIQSWKAATHPAGDSRPGWKVLRVLANFLNQDGFEYTTAEQVCSETSQVSKTSLNPAVFTPATVEKNKLSRIHSLPIYRIDAVTRRAQPLQQTSDNPAAVATLHPETLARIGVEEGGMVEISHADRKIEITVMSNASIPESCVLLPTAMPETAELGAANWLEVKHSA